MAEHRAGVAEAEIDVAMTVDVGKRRAAGFLHVERERGRPVLHPVQRHAEQQVLGRFRGQRAGNRHGFGERLAFAIEQRAGADEVDSVAGRQRQLLGCGDGGNDSAGGAGLTRGGITEAVGSGREGGAYRWRALAAED